jgi:tol-pal system protein YbgF
MRLVPTSLSLRLRPLVVFAAVMAGLSNLAHASLFEDDEARRAILEMRQQRTQDADALNTKLNALNAQIDQLKRSLLDMNAQIEQLRGDLAHQRGANEVLTRDLTDVQQKQKDTQTALDARMRKLEPQSVTLDGKTFQVDPEEKQAFDEALARLRGADFAAGAAGLNSLLQRFPSSGYRESAWYWLGNAYYGLRDYKQAIANFKQVVDQAPDHPRAPESLLSIANCQGELKETTAARKTLEQVIKAYPQTEAAQAARDRLLTMAPPAKGHKTPVK